nr:GDSL-type esterase/lipase family protein [Methylonatrum kenyense]
MVLITLLACSSAPTPQLPLLPSEARVLAFGDSLTRGTGAGEADAAYPAMLAERIGHTVINAGVPGEESAEGLIRLPEVLDSENPDLLLLCHGGNDLLRNRDEDQLRDNLRKMVAYARDRDIPVVLIAVPARALPLRPATVYGELADELELPLLESTVSDILRDNSLRADPIHPNAAGYARLAEALHELLTEAGALN